MLDGPSTLHAHSGFRARGDGRLGAREGTRGTARASASTNVRPQRRTVRRREAGRPGSQMPATVFGVPTHPLTVHAAVVLVPLAAIAVVVAALWPAARRRYGPVVLILATLALVSVPVAKESGESLARRLPGTPLIQQHIAMADGLLPWAAGLWIAAVAVVVLPWVWSLATSAQAATTDREASVPRGVRGRPGRHGRSALDGPGAYALRPRAPPPGAGPSRDAGRSPRVPAGGVGVVARSGPGLRRLPRGDAGSGSHPRLWRWSPQWGRRQRSSASAIRGPKRSGPGRQPPPGEGICCP